MYTNKCYYHVLLLFLFSPDICDVTIIGVKPVQ